MFLCVMMIIVFLLPLLVSSRSQKNKKKNEFEIPNLGRGLFMPSQTFLSPSSNVQVLDVSQEDVRRTVLDKSFYEYTFFDDQTSFYTYAAIQTNMGAKFTYNDWTFGLSLESIYSSAQFFEYEVKGVSNHYFHLYADYVLEKTAYKFTDEVLSTMESLPPIIDNPHLSSSWMIYDDFLNLYGSHVIVGGIQGSRIETFSMAHSTVQYTEKDFKIKSCLDLEGPEPLSFNASICAEYSKEERDEVKSLDITSRLKIFGGNPETRTKLMVERTSDLIETFLNEYNVSDTPVIFYYKPIWEVIYSMYDYGSREYYIGRNLEAYFLGFEGFKCDYLTDGKAELRKFIYDGGRYICVRPVDGCTSNSDCKWVTWGSTCGCAGDKCFTSETQYKYGRDYAEVRHHISGGHLSGINKSCYYHVGVYCACSNSHAGEMCTLWDQNLSPPTPSTNVCHPYRS